MIEFKNVALHYHYDEYALLKDLNFTLTDGVNTVLCDTQSGKTSICKLLTKQFKPTDGHIFVDGQDISSITNECLGILYIPSNPSFFENRSVKYNVTYPLKVRKVCKSERTERFERVARSVGLSEVKTKVKKLPLRERKRAALARGLTVERRVVLLDDFCDDAEQIDGIIKLFNGAATVIFTSDVALARGNVVILDGGVTVYCGDAEGAREIRKNLSWIVDSLRNE